MTRTDAPRRPGGAGAVAHPAPRDGAPSGARGVRA